MHGQLGRGVQALDSNPPALVLRAGLSGRGTGEGKSEQNDKKTPSVSTWSTNTCARGSTRVPSGAQCARLGCIATVWTATFGGLREPSAHRRTMCISPRCDYVLPFCFACTLLATGLRAVDTAKGWQSRHVRKALTRICTCTHHGSHHGFVLCTSFERLRSFLNSAWVAATAAQTY